MAAASSGRIARPEGAGTRQTLPDPVPTRRLLPARYRSGRQPRGCGEAGERPARSRHCDRDAIPGARSTVPSRATVDGTRHPEEVADPPPCPRRASFRRPLSAAAAARAPRLHGRRPRRRLRRRRAAGRRRPRGRGALAARLPRRVEEVLASPSRRARETAACAGLGVTAEEPALAECDFGRWAGPDAARRRRGRPDGVRDVDDRAGRGAARRREPEPRSLARVRVARRPGRPRRARRWRSPTAASSRRRSSHALERAARGLLAHRRRPAGHHRAARARRPLDRRARERPRGAS